MEAVFKPQARHMYLEESKDLNDVVKKNFTGQQKNKIKESKMEKINLIYSLFHGEWNYSILTQ